MKKVYYIATAEALDNEMKKRIQSHKKRRNKNWATIEEPLNVAGVLNNIEKNANVLIDCITLLMNNYFKENYNEKKIQSKFIEIIKSIRNNNLHAVIVTNEIGSGIVPSDKNTRRFRDIQGKINQYIGKEADEVYLLTCGISLKIKGET